MTHLELINTLVKRTGFLDGEVRQVMDELIKIVGEELVEGNKVTINNLAVFHVKTSRETTIPNYHTKEIIHVPKKNRVKTSIATSLAKMVANTPVRQ